MTDKVTPKSMKNQYDHQLDTFKRKNHDYGNSFEKSLDTFGLVAGIVRMNDKFERLVSLNDPSKDAQIASESLVDTLEDLSNYAAMAACWLKRKKEQNWAKERLTAIKKEGVPTCKELNKFILERKLKALEKVTKEVEDNDPKHKVIGVMPARGNGKSASVQQAIKEALDKDIEDARKIFYTPNFTKALLKGPKEKNDDVEVYWVNKLIDNMAVGGDIKIEDKPKFDGIRLFGPKELELNLNEEIDQDKLFKISNALHPSNLPKSVKVDYGHKAVYEFPDGIDTIASYLKQLSKEEAKKENDRVMLDMMLSRIEKGEVVRIVANGDGSFTTYFEKTDGPFDKIVDKEDESIFHEREGWEEEVKLEGQNGSYVTFTEDDGIFSFGDGVIARSLGDITLTAGPCKPKEKNKTLNEIRKEHGFDPVNGEDNEG